MAASKPVIATIKRLCDQGYESNRKGVIAVSPGAIVTFSTPVRSR